MTNSNSNLPPIMRGGKESFKYFGRLTTAFLGVLALTGAAVKGVEAIAEAGSPSSLAVQLAHSYEKDANAVSRGEFPKGSVMRVPLINGDSAYANALALAGGDAYSGNETEMQQDIRAEAGDLIEKGSYAFLPAKDVVNPPTGSKVY